MRAIWQRELKLFLTSWQAVFYLSLILILSFSFSIQPFFPFQLPTGNLNRFSWGIQFFIAIFGFLVLFLHSHAIIQEEIRSKRIRLYITKVPRSHFLWGKFLSTLSFWLVIIIGGYFLLSFLQPSLFVPKEGWKTVFVLFSFTTFYVGLIVLLSTLITHPFYLMIVGLSISLFLLIFSFLDLFQPNLLFPQIQLCLPLHWIQLAPIHYLLVPTLLGLIFPVFATILLNRKDL